jgi:uncharacterized protein with HEPN domain
MRDERLYLQDIIEAINAIEGFLTNIKEEDFASNDLIQSAVLYKLSIIGKASNHISAELRNRYPQVEWKEIIGFRNFAVHAYFALNQPIVWTTATEDTAILKEQILQILKKEFPDFELRNETK